MLAPESGDLEFVPKNEIMEPALPVFPGVVEEVVISLLVAAAAMCVWGTHTSLQFSYPEPAQDPELSHKPAPASESALEMAQAPELVQEATQAPELCLECAKLSLISWGGWLAIRPQWPSQAPSSWPQWSRRLLLPGSCITHVTLEAS